VFKLGVLDDQEKMFKQDAISIGVLAGILVSQQLANKTAISIKAYLRLAGIHTISKEHQSKAAIIYLCLQSSANIPMQC
jgi:hypothetical protein